MATEVKGSGQTLEQFVLLAKTAKGAALESLINQLLEVPGVYVFGEFLEMPNVQELMGGPFTQCYQLLTLFAYGTFSDYLANSGTLPELTPAQKNKLRHLSIVTLADKLKCIPYSMLLRELGLHNLRELEDLIIEAIYADIVQGKLDQRNELLEVDASIGRDIRPQDVRTMARTLQEWCNGCEAVLSGIEDQISRADQYREHQLQLRHQIETEVNDESLFSTAPHRPPSPPPPVPLTRLTITAHFSPLRPRVTDPSACPPMLVHVPVPVPVRAGPLCSRLASIPLNLPCPCPCPSVVNFPASPTSP
ncbi:COP9 signalosome complex subunit 7a-like, partial [Mobula hypostoma]|uniref:COP9 signalosome complex subunit 7a-like n=1 Tax=Mobula hypostoma TaxID=723540 RepID=UPI002FC299D4